MTETMAIQDRHFYTLANTQARKEYGGKNMASRHLLPSNQGNPLETMESPAARAQESQETIHQVASSPSTLGGLNWGHATRT
jgi:hypothetical protein